MNWTKILVITLPFLVGCQQGKTQKEPKEANLTTPVEKKEQKETPVSKSFTLNDFYGNDDTLLQKTEMEFNQLTTEEKIAQMIITSAGELGKPKNTIRKLVKQHAVGGVIFLKGQKAENAAFIQELNQLQGDKTPLLYSIDAEPSLYNKRVLGSKLKIKKTIDIQTEAECKEIARLINSEIKPMGFLQNFAPVVDLSPNNEAIKSRSHGSNPEVVVNMAKAFIQATQKDGIVATAKHFPGHGYVKGDTHKQSVYIDGELQEVGVYEPLIKAGVISVMVGHITVKNNDLYSTDGLPATCSPKIVQHLLKEKMGFKGIVITDAMNIMKAVTKIDNSPLLAAKAGCDMILMPPNETQLAKDIIAEMEKDASFKTHIETAVKKIIRLKICLGLIQ